MEPIPDRKKAIPSTALFSPPVFLFYLFTLVPKKIMKKGGKKSNVKVQQQNNPASREKSAKREREGPPLREAGTLRQNKLEYTAFPNGITGQRSVFVLRQVYISHLVFSLWFVR